jgi:hypothetical protein
MTNQVNEKKLLVLVIISSILTIGIVIGMIVNARLKPENCWDKYQTEEQAILHCETHEPIIGD